MPNHRFGAIAPITALLVFALASTAGAQGEPSRFVFEARGGVNVPTFDIEDAVDPGPSFGAGLGVRLTQQLWFFADADFGFHSGAELAGGLEGPDVNVYHFIGKLGYEIVSPETSGLSVILNAGGGALTFDGDGADANTYPAINVGAKIAYQVTPRFALLLSPQGDIAFTDEDEVGTDNAWVWPFTAGLRIGF